MYIDRAVDQRFLTVRQLTSVPAFLMIDFDVALFLQIEYADAIGVTSERRACSHRKRG